MPFLLCVLTLGLGKDPPAPPYVGTAEDWKALLFDLLRFLYQMGWSWRQQLVSRCAYLPTFNHPGQRQRHLWMCTQFHVVHQEPLVCVDVSWTYVLTSLLGWWKQIEGTFRCSGGKVSVSDWVSVWSQIRRIMGGAMIPKCSLRLQFCKYTYEGKSHWKKMRQDLADVDGIGYELRIVSHGRQSYTPNNHRRMNRVVLMYAHNLIHIVLHHIR